MSLPNPESSGTLNQPTFHNQQRSVPCFLPVLALAFGLLWSASALTQPPGQPDNGLVILQYHHIDDDTPPSTSTSPAIFQDHLNYLVANEYKVVSLPSAISTLRSGLDLPPRSVAITFDDAYDSIYNTALPMLVAHEMPFTVFVATDYMNRPHYMSTAQMREMLSQRVSFANHTRSHVHLQRKLDGEDDAAWERRIVDEIEGAEQILGEALGEQHKLLAYPYGEYNLRVLSTVDKLGYTAFGQQSGPASHRADFALLPRFPMGGPYSSMKQFPTKVASLPMPLTGAQRIEPLAEETRPELNITLSGDNLRLHQLACYGPGGAVEMTQEGSHFIIRGIEPIPSGRSRYNCTMPARVARGNRQTYHWYSQLWLRKRSDGSWHPD